MAIVTKTVTLYPTNLRFSDAAADFNVSNAFNPSTNTTYAYHHLKTGSKAVTTIYYGFDFSSVPSSATITSMSLAIKVKTSNATSSYISTAYVNAVTYDGETATKLGTDISFRSTTASIKTISCSTVSRAALSNVCASMVITRGTSYTTTSYAAWIYGATLTVTFSYDDTIYVNTSCNQYGTVTPSGQTTLSVGDSFTATITPSNRCYIFDATDNNVSVMGSIYSSKSSANYLATRYESLYCYKGVESLSAIEHPIGKGYDTTDRDTTNKAYGSDNNNAALCAYWFDFSQIPSGATIINITCKASVLSEKIKIGGKYVGVDNYINLCKGSELTQIVTPTVIDRQLFNSYSSDTIIDFTCGSWTRQDLDDLCVMLEIPTKYIGYGAIVQGITVHVEYCTPYTGGTGYYSINNIQENHNIVITFTTGAGTDGFIRVNDTWKKIASVYKKTNGVWVQQDKLGDAISSGDKFKLVNL